MNQQVTDFIQSAAEEQKDMMEKLRRIIQEQVPHVVEDFKWGRPVFRTSKNFAYFKTTKAYLTFGFFHFHNLRDENKLLEGTGKDMRHIKLKSQQDLNEELMKEWILASSN